MNENMKMLVFFEKWAYPEYRRTGIFAKDIKDAIEFIMQAEIKTHKEPRKICGGYNEFKDYEEMKANPKIKDFYQMRFDDPEDGYPVIIGIYEGFTFDDAMKNKDFRERCLGFEYLEIDGVDYSDMDVKSCEWCYLDFME